MSSALDEFAPPGALILGSTGDVHTGNRIPWGDDRGLGCGVKVSARWQCSGGLGLPKTASSPRLSQYATDPPPSTRYQSTSSYFCGWHRCSLRRLALWPSARKPRLPSAPSRSRRCVWTCPTWRIAPRVRPSYPVVRAGSPPRARHARSSADAVPPPGRCELACVPPCALPRPPRPRCKS